MPAADIKKITTIPVSITLLLIVMLAALLFIKHVSSNFSKGMSDDVLNDMSIFLKSGEDFLHNGQLYQRFDDYQDNYGADAPVYKFPPLYQITIIPLLKWHVDIEHILYIQRWLYLIIYLSSAWLILHRSIKLFYDCPEADKTHEYSKTLFLSFSAIFILSFSAFFESHLNLHPELIILFLLTSVLLLWPRWPIISGALLAVAALIKIYPIFVLPIFFLTKSWRVLLGFAIGFLLSVGITIYYFGTGEPFFYLKNIFPVLLGEETVNHSQNLALAKFLYEHQMLNTLNGNFQHILNTLTALTLICVLGFINIKSHKETQLYFGMFISGILISLPNYWLQYQLILMIPIILLTALLFQQRSKVLLPLMVLILISTSYQSDWIEWTNAALVHGLQNPDFLMYYNKHGMYTALLHFSLSKPQLLGLFLLTKLNTCIYVLKIFTPYLLFLMSFYVLLINDKRHILSKR